MGNFSYLITKMIEYQFSFDDIEKVRHSVLHSQNAYLNREIMKLVRLVNRMLRRDEHVGSEIMNQFIALAYQYKPEEKTEKAPLNEIIQIFA